MDFGVNHFSYIDYIIVTATLLVSLGIGLYHGYASKQTTEDLLVGGRSMGPLPIACSMMVTYFSAIAILGNIKPFIPEYIDTSLLHPFL